MDYSYLNQAGFDPSSAMSSLQSAAAASAVVSSEANFYSALGGTCPSTAAAAAMMPSYYGTLGGRNHSSVMRSAYGGPGGPVGGMPTPTGSPTSCGVIPRNTTDHHRQSMFGAGMGLNSKFLKKANYRVSFSKNAKFHNKSKVFENFVLIVAKDNTDCFLFVI